MCGHVEKGVEKGVWRWACVGGMSLSALISVGSCLLWGLEAGSGHSGISADIVWRPFSLGLRARHRVHRARPGGPMFWPLDLDEQ